jgi:hypothetical protein
LILGILYQLGQAILYARELAGELIERADLIDRNIVGECKPERRGRLSSLL